MPPPYNPGLYTVRYSVKDLSGNQSDEVLRMVNMLSTGIDATRGIGSLLELYPNPCQGMLWIRLNATATDDVQLTVLDLSGKELLTKAIKAGNTQSEEIDLRFAAKGLYLLRVTSAGRTYTQKLQVN
jgi:hypothetical protein